MSTSSRTFSDDVPNRLGRAIQVRRTLLQLQRRDLAEAAELSYPYICELEKGSKEPSAKTLRQLAEALRFSSTTDFLTWVEQLELEPADDADSLSVPLAELPANAARTISAASLTTARSWQARPASSAADVDAVIDQAVQRLTDRVLDLLAREIPRLVEQEVARQLDEVQRDR